jgi:hypothetical protein
MPKRSNRTTLLPPGEIIKIEKHSITTIGSFLESLKTHATELKNRLWKTHPISYNDIRATFAVIEDYKAIRNEPLFCYEVSFLGSTFLYL